MTKQAATQIRDMAIKAIADLSALLKGADGNCSAKEYENLRRAVANTIALIDKDILWALFTISRSRRSKVRISFRDFGLEECGFINSGTDEVLRVVAPQVLFTGAPGIARVA